MSLRKRMIDAQLAAGFSTADMCTWFDGIGHTTMRNWLADTEPAEHRRPQLEESLKLLEAAIMNRVELPVPLKVTQFTRKDYIRAVKNDIAVRLSESRPAGTRGKVLGVNPSTER